MRQAHPIPARSLESETKVQIYAITDNFSFFSIYFYFKKLNNNIVYVNLQQLGPTAINGFSKLVRKINQTSSIE